MAKNRDSGGEVNLSSPENRISIPILFREIFEFKVWQLKKHHFSIHFRPIFDLLWLISAPFSPSIAPKFGRKVYSGGI